MSRLLVKGKAVPDADGLVMDISPESAGWTYVGFQIYRMSPGGTLVRPTGDREACLVLLSGRADVKTNKAEWRNIGERMSVFEGKPPYSVYVPSGDGFEVTALTDLELAVCLAPGWGTHPARLIEPGDVGVETRGYGNMERRIHNILPETQPADSLLVVEVFTPDGHWSSYPPHKHDVDDPPRETCLEETYFHKIRPEHGFAVQRVYTDDRRLDETLVVRNNDAVLVPGGYHPVAAPPGYEVYYLNVMAGPVRAWRFHNDPDHEWLIKK